jgi:hypothetical protein
MSIQDCSFTRLAALAAALSAVAPAMAADPAGSGDWHYRAAIYAYMPSIDGTTSFPDSGGGSGITVSGDQLLDALEFAFMGNLEAHNGRWGGFTDFVYLNLGADKSGTRDFSLGPGALDPSISANLDYGLKGWSWTLAGEYRLVSDPALSLDLLAGARLFDIEQTLTWNVSGNLGTPPLVSASGNATVNLELWDAIVGVKGRYALGKDGKWSLPFYLDVGTGDSDLTVQAAAGVSRAFEWGEVSAVWRYLGYELDANKPVQEVSFNGPQIGVAFVW